MSIVVCGIDPSLKRTGVVSGTSPDQYKNELFCAGDPDNELSQRVRRYVEAVDRIDKRLEEIAPSLILIEAYAFSRNGKGQMWLGEFGGIIRWHIVDRAPPGNTLEVTPNQLKQFATGKGNADKIAVQNAVGQRWGKFFQTTDECDAYVLFRMGLVIAGTVEAENQHQRDAVAKVLGGRKLNLNPAPTEEPE